jgi:hypothetical protein
MRKNPYKTLNVAQDLHHEIKVYAANRNMPAGELIAQIWAAYLANQDQPRVAPKETASLYPYRPENREWHDRLEMTLNDPDEALGIMKNLEWAERTVAQKTPRNAKRANGT